MADAPDFWYKKKGLKALALWPISLVYGSISSRRMNADAHYRPSIPVLCVGNFVAGGGGKTPSVIALAGLAKKKGYRPALLSRGYGGALNGPVWVDDEAHNARDVGDEPLLLARAASTMVSRDRVAGAKAIEADGQYDLIIMDDGFQSPNLIKDFCLLVVDGLRGVGNGMVHPSGPLRVPFSNQILKADALLKIGGGEGSHWPVRQAARRAKPIFTGFIKPKRRRSLRGKKVFAWAGIANPHKFVKTLEDLGAKVEQTLFLGDHQVPHVEQIDDMFELADQGDLILITTEKDQVRIAGEYGKKHKQLLERSQIVAIGLELDDGQGFGLLFDLLEKKFKARKLKDGS